MKRLAIISTHPIQYNAPMFKLLANRHNIKLKVFYTWERGAESFDKGFGKKIEWNIPLLHGYDYEFISNNGNFKRGFWDLRNPGLNKTIEKWGATHVLVFGWNYFSHLNAMRYFKGKIPVLFRGDSHLLGKMSGVKRFLRKTFLSWVYKYIDFALYVGTNNKAYYKEFGLKDEQLIFVPHAIDNDRFKDSEEHDFQYQALKWRNSLGFRVKDIVLAYIGKIDKVKQINLLVEAFQSISNENIKLLIVGNGQMENEIKQMAQSDDRIQFLDFQNQKIIPIVYRIADIYVLPSNSETWGLAVNEAFACGRTVIVSDKVGCAIDLVTDGLNGFVFTSGSITDLIKKINLALRSNLKQMGLNGSYSINTWSFENQVFALEKLLNSKINQ